MFSIQNTQLGNTMTLYFTAFMWVPFSWVLVEHQAEERRSVEAQEL